MDSFLQSLSWNLVTAKINCTSKWNQQKAYDFCYPLPNLSRYIHWLNLQFPHNGNYIHRKLVNYLKICMTYWNAQLLPDFLHKSQFFTVIIQYKNKFTFFCHTTAPGVGPMLPNFEISKSHTIGHTTPVGVSERVINLSQRPLLVQYTTSTRYAHQCSRQNLNLQSQQLGGCTPTP